MGSRPGRSSDSAPRRSPFPRRNGAVYTHDGGFYHAVDPTTGAVGHRMLVLDQSMIMAALDNALNRDRMQRWYAEDPIAAVDKLYSRAETMSL